MAGTHSPTYMHMYTYKYKWVNIIQVSRVYWRKLIKSRKKRYCNVRSLRRRTSSRFTYVRPPKLHGKLYQDHMSILHELNIENKANFLLMQKKIESGVFKHLATPRSLKSSWLSLPASGFVLMMRNILFWIFYRSGNWSLEMNYGTGIWQGQPK